MAFEWTDLLEPAMGLGGSLLGNKIQAGASKEGIKEDARQFDTRTARSDQARNMLMPAIQRHLGYTAPSNTFGGGGTAYGGQVQQKGGSALGKIGSIASGVGGAASLAGMGGLGGLPFLGAAGPLGAAAGGIILGAKLLRKIGAGRRAANQLTENGGIQQHLDAAIREISARQADGRITPEQHDLLIEKVFRDAAQKGVLHAGQGPNQRKTVQQMLNTYNWNPVMARIAPEYLRQLG
jgi:hypothetical protein